MSVRRYITAFVACLGLCTLTASAQDFDFDGYYAPANWTTSGDGSVDSSGAPASITLIGPNAGAEGFLDIEITVPSSGTFSFNWSYFTEDDPGFDDAGFLLNDTFFFLADTTGTNGSVSQAVNAGDVIGLIVSVEIWLASGTLSRTDVVNAAAFLVIGFGLAWLGGRVQRAWRAVRRTGVARRQCHARLHVRARLAVRWPCSPAARPRSRRPHPTRPNAC